MNLEKIQENCKELKQFFISKRITTGAAKEAMFRLIEYIDTHYPEDSDKPFLGTNGLANTNNYKQKGFGKLEVKHAQIIGTRVSRWYR